MDVISMVREGMKVISASGDDVGTVKSVKMGDPNAVTAEGQGGEDREGLLTALARGLTGGEEMSAERRERLLRMGYVEVEGAGLNEDFFVAGDRVDRVADDTVYLNVDEPR